MEMNPILPYPVTRHESQKLEDELNGCQGDVQERRNEAVESRLILRRYCNLLLSSGRLLSGHFHSYESFLREIVSIMTR